MKGSPEVLLIIIDVREEAIGFVLIISYRSSIVFKGLKGSTYLSLRTAESRKFAHAIVH